MLYNEIKFEIDINNDELLKILWNIGQKIQRGERYGVGGYYEIDKPPSPSSLFLPLSHIFKRKLIRVVFKGECDVQKNLEQLTTTQFHLVNASENYDEVQFIAIELEED
jgi:hypothetical protein